VHFRNRQQVYPFGKSWLPDNKKDYVNGGGDKFLSEEEKKREKFVQGGKKKGGVLLSTSVLPNKEHAFKRGAGKNDKGTVTKKEREATMAVFSGEGDVGELLQGKEAHV